MKTFLALGMMISGIAVAQLAAAQQCTSLVYVGAPFTSVTTTGNAPVPVNGPLTGTVTLMTPLPANGVGTPVAFTAFDFSSVASELMSGDMMGAPWYANETPTFYFTTVNGVITDWTANLNYFPGGGAITYNIFVSSTPEGDTVTFDTNFPTGPGGPSTVTGTSSAAGTWSCVNTFSAAYTAPIVPPPPPPVNPLAASLAAAQAQVTTLTARIATLQVASTAANAKIGTLTAQVSTLTSQVTTLTASRNLYESDYVATSKSLTAAKATIATDTKTIATLNAKIAAMQKAALPRGR